MSGHYRITVSRVYDINSDDGERILVTAPCDLDGSHVAVLVKLLN